MQINGWDIAVLVLSGWYVTTRFNGGKNDSFNRATLGVITGVGAAKFGPEIYNRIKQHVTTIDRDKVLKAAVGVTTGAIGYNLTDIVTDQIKNYRQNKQQVTP